jgi:ferrous iron transport protein A
MKRIIRMRNMSDNQDGIVTKISVSGEMGRRIRDMGLIKGTPIRIIGRAPLYDPVAIKVRDYTLTLRNNEADFIEVEVDDGENE